MENRQHLETLTEIRSLMERSSRFLSLSGLAGVFAGLYALAGAGAIFYYFNQDPFAPLDFSDMKEGSMSYNLSILIPLFVVAVLVFVLAVGTAFLLSIRHARKRGLPIWDKTARRLLINTFIPMTAGALFGGILLYRGLPELVAPVALLFYGMALLNASKYTLNDIRYVGISNIVLGLIAALYVQYSIQLWAIGFGILHIFYGAFMYSRYER